MKTKANLSFSTGLSGLDFKIWPKEGKNVFSVKIDRNYRAHLILEEDSGHWIADRVGNHKSMGHG